MSYNKFFNKILLNSNQNNGNILTLNNSNTLLSFKKNINFNIDNLQENIKLDQTDKTQLNIKKIVDSNDSSVQFNSASFSNILKIEDTNFYIDGNNNFFVSSSNVNQNLNFNTNIDFEGDVKSKKIQGLLKYVDKERQIPWISGSEAQSVFTQLTFTGFEINKRNANLESLTYVTCDPGDGFSTYSLNDVVTNTNINGNYNFVNADGAITNTLYIKPGATSLTKKKYLSGNEHNFVIDFKKSLLPGWGFEQNHPINQITSYLPIKNEILNYSSDIKKKLQSIALDFSDLLQGNQVSPGYTINLIFKSSFVSEDYPECMPCIFHSSNSIVINDPTTSWENNTFESRLCNFSKSDLLDPQYQNVKSYFDIQKASFDSGTNGTVTTNSTTTINLLPYFNSTGQNIFNENIFPKPSNQTVNANQVPSTNQYFPKGNYFRQFGSYISNRIILNYFKPLFYINLGNNNVIINSDNRSLLQKINLKINTQPFYKSNITTLNSIYNKTFENNYFISDNKTTDELSFYKNPLQDISYASSQSIHFNSTNLYNVDTLNQNNNFSLQLKIQNFNNLIKHFFISNLKNFKRIYNTGPAYYNIYLGSGTTPRRSSTTITWGFKFNILKSHFVFNLPFTNLKVSNNTNLNDFYYLDIWKIHKNNFSNEVKDLSTENIDVQKNITFKLSTTAGASTVNELPDDEEYIKNEYSVTPGSIDVNGYFYKRMDNNFISLKYLGYNSENSTHEWAYV